MGEHKFVAVVGAVNIDIGGHPFAPLVLRDSNPGRVRTSLGGVGRNIAHNMRLLGLDVSMITAMGEDDSARKISASCAALGIDLSRSLRVPGGVTSTYLFLTEQNGDMALAVSDMEIYAQLTPAVLAPHLALLDSAALVVLDTNLPDETIVYLAEHCKAPLFADPVSTTKASKLRPILGKLHTLKPNRLEAELLSGIAIRDEASLRRAADALLASGLRRVFISLGSYGVFAADGVQARYLPCVPGETKNTTGCGDAFLAALAWSHQEKLDLSASARAGLAAAAIAMEGEETINPALNAESLRCRAKPSIFI